MSELQDRLTALAERGTPRGADAVLDAASKKAVLDVIVGERADDDLDPIPFVTTEPIAMRRPRRRFGSMISAAGIATMLLVGMLAISALVGSGGASSPEAAVRRLADAISHEDALAAADVLAPSEVRSLHGTLDAAQHRAAELSLVKTAAAPLTGVDLSVDDIKLTTTPLGDGFAKVTVDRGTISASTKKTNFSPLMQKVLRDSEDNSTKADLAMLDEQRPDLPTFVVVVRQEGHWYVSAAYTALEYLRVYNDLPAADYGSGARATSTLGADSPDAAVQDAMRALQRSDWSKLMTLARPDELPVYDYRDALITLAQRDEWKTTFTIDTLSTTSDVQGDTALVTLHASGKTDRNRRWSVEGGCYTPPPNDNSTGPSRVCLPKAPVHLFDVYGLTTPSTAGGPSQITVVQRNGRWFVSPVGTVLDVLNTWIRNIDRRGLYSMLQLPSELEPDGEIRLGAPVTVPGAVRGLHVFTLEGHQGEHLVGLVRSAGTKELFSYSGEVIGPDGKQIDGGLFYGGAVSLPADGTYRISVFNYLGADMQVTVWNEKNAPTEATQFPNKQCTSSLNGTTECFPSPTKPAPAIPSGKLPSVYVCTATPTPVECTSKSTMSTVPRP